MTARRRIVLALILSSAFTVYARTLRFPFVFDDVDALVHNPIIRSWRFFPRYFTEHVWQEIDPEEAGEYYRPLFLAWARLNHALFAYSPWGWHLTTILAHLATIVLVGSLAFKLTRDRWTAGVAALVFALHPIHVEVVAWVCGVTESLVAVPVIGSFLCYLEGRERGSAGTKWKAASLLLFAAGLLSKETALALPPLVFAHEWIWSGQSSWRARLETGARSSLPFFALVIPYLVVRQVVLGAFSTVITPLPWLTMVLTWPLALWFYLRLLLWPVGLSPCYDIPYVARPDFPNFFLPLAALGATAWVLYAWFRHAVAHADEGELRSRLPQVVAFAAVWLVVPVVPALDLKVLPRGFFEHDRFLYLPSVGFAILVALALRTLVRSVEGALAVPKPCWVAVGLLACALGSLTVYDSLFYSSSEVLWSRGIAIDPTNPYLQNNLANLMVSRGAYAPALTRYRQILARAPEFWWANYNMGYAYYRMGKLPEAEWWLRRAITIFPYKPDQYLYLGATELKMGNTRGAEAAFHQALRVRPDVKTAHFALGVILKTRGDLEGARREFEEEKRVNPGARTNLEQLSEVESLLQKQRLGPE